MARRRRRFAAQPQPLADLQLFAGRDGRQGPAGRDLPDGGLSLTEASQVLSPEGTRPPGGGLYRYQNPGKHRRAIEQRYGNNE